MPDRSVEHSHLAQIYTANKVQIERGILQEETTGAVMNGLGLGTAVGVGAFVACRALGIPPAESAAAAGTAGAITGTLGGVWAHWSAPATVINKYLHEGSTFFNAHLLGRLSSSSANIHRRDISSRASSEFLQSEAIGLVAGTVAGILGSIPIEKMGHGLIVKAFELSQFNAVTFGEKALKVGLEGASWLIPAGTIITAGALIGDSVGVMIGINNAVNEVRRAQGGQAARQFAEQEGRDKSKKQSKLARRSAAARVRRSKLRR